MKLEFFKRTASDRATIIKEAAARRGLLSVMVEKDYRAMRPMFMQEPPPFEMVITAVTGLEHRINQIA